MVAEVERVRPALWRPRDARRTRMLALLSACLFDATPLQRGRVLVPSFHLGARFLMWIRPEKRAAAHWSASEGFCDVSSGALPRARAVSNAASDRERAPK